MEEKSRPYIDLLTECYDQKCKQDVGKIEQTVKVFMQLEPSNLKNFSEEDRTKVYNFAIALLEVADNFIEKTSLEKNSPQYKNIKKHVEDINYVCDGLLKAIGKKDYTLGEKFIDFLKNIGASIKSLFSGTKTLKPLEIRKQSDFESAIKSLKSKEIGESITNLSQNRIGPKR